MSELRRVDGVEVVFINNKPYDKWTITEHKMWQRETMDNLEFASMVGQKLLHLAKSKGWIK